MPAKNPRIKALRSLRDRPHLFTTIRRVTLSVTLVLLYAVPLSGMAQADLVGGNHMAAFAPVSWLLPSVLSMVIVAALFWAATIVLTMFLGRVFCGFGCLVGHSARLADHTELAEQSKKAKDKRRKYVAWATQAVVSVVFAGGIALWWVDLSLLWRGTLGQAFGAAGIYLAVLGAVVAHGRYWRWGFCKQVCPIGLYYSVVGQGARFGIAFDPEHCNDCNLCDKACPVNLTPRELDQPHKEAEGLSFSDMPERNHCLVCGDCVRACQVSLSKKEVAPALSLSFSPKKKKRLPVLSSAPSPREAPAGAQAEPETAQEPPSDAPPKSATDAAA